MSLGYPIDNFQTLWLNWIYISIAQITFQQSKIFPRQVEWTKYPQHEEVVNVMNELHTFAEFGRVFVVSFGAFAIITTIGVCTSGFANAIVSVATTLVLSSTFVNVCHYACCVLFVNWKVKMKDLFKKFEIHSVSLWVVMLSSHFFAFDSSTLRMVTKTL